MRGYSATLLLVVASAFACATDRGAGSVTTYDSAGVQIVVSREVHTLAPAFQLDPEPLVRLGGLRHRPEEEFDSRHPWLSALILDDGTVVVNDATELKFFDRSGRFLRATGRAGEGPGEFGNIRELCRTRGDTLVAVDYTSPRVSVYSPAGEFVRSVTVLGHVPMDPCFADGSILAQRMATAVEGGGDGERSAELFRVRTDGSEVGDITRAPRSTYGLIAREVSTPVVDDVLVVAAAERYELRVYSQQGELLRIIRSQTEPRPLNDGEWNRAAEASIPMNVVGPQRAAQLVRLKSAPRPSHYPAYGRVRSDAKRRLWVQDYGGGREGWTIFSLDGRAFGRFTPPSELGELVGVGGDHIVFRRTDADGAPELLIHRLLEP